MGGRQRRQARSDEHAEPGQSADGREEGDPRHRRVGTRLLPEVSKPPAGLSWSLVECRELDRSQSLVEGLTLFFLLLSTITAGAQPAVTGTLSNTTRVESWSYFQPKIDPRA